MHQGRPAAPGAAGSVGELIEPAAFFYLTPEPGLARPPGQARRAAGLTRLVDSLSQHAGEDAQIIPVSVFWGQSPDSESSPWKLLFADSWAVTGRLRRLLRILILGRKTRVQFSAPIICAS
jgi:glycerol-3-phosphate O-acyltransferase